MRRFYLHRMYQQVQGYPSAMASHVPVMAHPADIPAPYDQQSRVPWTMPVHTPIAHPLAQSRLVPQQEHYPIKSEDPSEWDSASMFQHQHQHVDPIQPFVGVSFMIGVRVIANLFSFSSLRCSKLGQWTT